MRVRIILILIIAMLVCGGFAHEFIPHSHSEEAVIADLMHTALRHEDKKLIAIPPLMVLFSVALAACASVFVFSRTLAIYRLLILAGGAEMCSLRRGITPYRKFR